jgi:hypothetical protein
MMEIHAARRRMNIKNSAACSHRASIFAPAAVCCGLEKRRKGARRTQYAARFAPKLLFCVSVWRQKMRVRALTLYQKSLVERKLCDVEIGFATTL